MVKVVKEVLRKTYLLLLKVLGNKGLGRVPILKQLNQKALKTIKSSFAIVNGFKMYLDEKDSLRLSLGEGYEKFETQIVKRLIKEGDIVVDCGAHIGYYTLLFSQLVGDSGKVFAFEPDPTNFSLLQKNLKENKIKNVVASNFAVSDKNGKCTFFLDKKSPAHHRLYSEGKMDKGEIKINCVRLDDYFKNFKKEINLIKMDIEGAEGKAIKGGLNILKRNKGIKIILEFFPFALKGCGVSANELLGILRNQGFDKIEEIKHTSGLSPIDKSTLLSKEHFKIKRATNLLFTNHYLAEGVEEDLKEWR